MDRTGRIRTVVFAVILLILAFFAVGYVRELYASGFSGRIINTEEINEINIDGSDFGWLFRLLGHGVNGLISFVVYGVYAVIVLIVSLVLVIPFRLIVVRRSTVISSEERRLTKIIFGAVVGVSLLLGLILTKGSCIAALIFYTAIWALIVLCVYILTTKKNCCF